jgi:hypothetical protein
MEQTTTVGSTNEQVIGEFFDKFQKQDYMEFFRDMFDSYIQSWRYLDLADLSKGNAVDMYRQIEKLIESIN